MSIIFRKAKNTDLEAIMIIERQSFSPAEAASQQAMAERIAQINDSFIVAVNEENTILGYVVGPVISERYLYDALFETTVKNPQTGGYQSILSLAVAKKYQKVGIASQLLEELAAVSKERKRIGITLTCLASLVPFYEKNGFQLEGLSDSQHAGEVWYNMVRLLEYEKPM